MRNSLAVTQMQRVQEPNHIEPERFVDSVVAAKFLSIERRQLLQLARAGKLPAYPIGDGQRRLWRFRLSDLARAMEERNLFGKSTANISKTRAIR